MSEASFDMVLQELRDTAPQAPERLRNLVSALPEARPRRSVRLRPALSIAIALVIAVGLGAALIGGLDDATVNQGGNRGNFFSAPEGSRTRTVRERATGADQGRGRGLLRPA